MKENERVFLAFVDREYGDCWVRMVLEGPRGIFVQMEKPGLGYWFFPWTSILGIRLEERTSESEAS